MHHLISIFSAGLLLFGGVVLGQGIAKRVTLFETAFEATEGYNIDFELAGQGEWTSEGTGGNGLLSEAFPAFGQQAFIGAFAPTGPDVFTSVWRPVNVDPVPAGVSIARFHTLMQIVPSLGGSDDNFRWSVYNAEGLYLFGIDFDTYSREISYILDNKIVKPANLKFDYEAIYDLVIWMDFSRNLWTATLNDRVVVNSEKISTLGKKLTLGDVDAVWAVYDSNDPGDNYMVFDNYQLFGEPLTSIPATLEGLDFTSKREFKLRVNGEEGLQYAIEVSSDLNQWFALGTFTAPLGGVFDFKDTTSPGEPMSFYRVKEVPPEAAPVQEEE
jgi:hypothetical protein